MNDSNLHSLAENGSYGVLKEELIKDRLVVGMFDAKTYEPVQLKDNLNLRILISKQVETQARPK